MNPWEWIWAVFSWSFLVLCAIGLLIIMFVIVVSIWRMAVDTLNPKPTDSLASYLRESKTVARDMYAEEVIMQAELIEAHQNGARWGWGYHHRPEPKRKLKIRITPPREKL